MRQDGTVKPQMGDVGVHIKQNLQGSNIHIYRKYNNFKWE